MRRSVESATGSSPRPERPELAAALHRLRSTLARLKAELELAEVDDVANVRKYLGEALDAVSDGMPADFVAMTLYAALGALQEGVVSG